VNVAAGVSTRPQRAWFIQCRIRQNLPRMRPSNIIVMVAESLVDGSKNPRNACKPAPASSLSVAITPWIVMGSRAPESCRSLKGEVLRRERRLPARGSAKRTHTHCE
jgi:hypothetical protein